MTTIDRNPDIDLGTEKIPPGYYVHEGKNLMQTARHCTPPVPFGVAWLKMPMGENSSRRETIGLVIREEHRARMDDALAKKAAKRKDLYS